MLSYQKKSLAVNKKMLAWFLLAKEKLDLCKSLSINDLGGGSKRVRVSPCVATTYVGWILNILSSE